MKFRTKKTLLIFLFCQVLLLGLGVVRIFHGHQADITLYEIPLYDSEGVYDGGKLEGEGEGNLFTTRYPLSEYKFIGRTGPLLAGVYEVKVYYGTYHDYYTISYEADEDGSVYPAVYADSCILDADDHEASYRVWVNSDINNLDICIECGKGMEKEDYQKIFEEGSHLYLDRIEVTRDYRMTVAYGFLKLFALLLLLGGLFCVWWNIRKIQEHFYAVFGLFCIFLVSSLSLMGHFNEIGHDMMFHYARIVGLAEGLAGGEFPVRVQPGWFHGYGYAASVCYGDALLYIPAVLYLFGVTLHHAYSAYVMLVNLGTLLLTYFCFKKISKSQSISVACTALYVLSITRILNVYLRMAVGEYTAMMFFPLILLGIFEIYEEDSVSNQRAGKGWLFLCLGMTGVIQTHVISTSMAGLFIALTALVLIRKMTRKVFLSFVKSVLSALCLNLSFLLPLLEYSTDALHIFDGRKFYNIQERGLSIYELFSIGTKGTGLSYSVSLGLNDRIPESVGAAMLILIVLAVVVCFRCPEWSPHEKNRLLVVMLLAGAALWMSTHYFPYNILTGIGFVKKNVHSIQYPWRFMSIAALLLACMGCLVFMKLRETAGREKLSCLLIGICLISAFQGLSYMDSIKRNMEDHSIYYDFRSQFNWWNIAMGKEYLLNGSSIEKTAVDQDVTGENIRAELLEQKGLRMDVACQAQENAWIEVPRFAYWHYRCSDVETKEVYPVTRGENNKIHVELPDHYQGTLRFDFVEPWYWRMAELVSFLGVLAVIFISLPSSWFVNLRRKTQTLRQPDKSG